MSTQASRIESLQSEIERLKDEQRQEKIAAKASRKWNAIAKKTPESNNHRAFVWADNQVLCGWFNDGAWYEYDGTWLLTEKNRIANVTHWMGTDWMSSREWPLYGPGIVNRLRYYWRCFSQGATNMAYRNMPKAWSTKAQLDRKIVYFKNDRTGEIRMGLPEHFPVTAGFHKVVCNTVQEAERWSDRLRQYNVGKEQRKDEEREAIEGQFLKEHRSHIHHLMANSRSKLGKEFLQRHLERTEMAAEKRRMVREEYLHSEAYEQNH